MNLTGYIKALSYCYSGSKLLEEINDLLECVRAKVPYTNPKIKFSKITIKEPFKISLNSWYSGGSWQKRYEAKQKTKWLLFSQLGDKKFTDDALYYVEYKTFSKNPLDATNTIAMIKIIEDIIFVKDDFKIIREISLASRKSKTEKIDIYIYKIDK